MAALSKVIFPTPKTVDLGAYIPTDFSLFMLIVPVLFIFKFATVPAVLSANIPTDLSPFTTIFCVLAIDNFCVPDSNFP